MASKENTYSRFSQVYELWLDQYKNTVKESTMVKTKAVFDNHILPAFGNMLLKNITVPYCQSMINAWYEEYARYDYIKQSVSRVLDFAVSLDCIKSNPMRKIRTPRKKKVSRDDDTLFYTKEELELFFRLLEEDGDLKHLAYFRLLAFSGARKSEISALTWQDVDYEHGTLNIDKTLSEGENYAVRISSTKTESSERVISLDAITLSVLKRWRSQQAKDQLKLGLTAKAARMPLLFPAVREHKPINISIPNEWLWAFYKRHPELKQIKVHGFRHTHCSLLFESGASIKEVQERLGHSDIQTTMNIYAHVSKKAREETADKFAAYVGF